MLDMREAAPQGRKRDSKKGALRRHKRILLDWMLSHDRVNAGAVSITDIIMAIVAFANDYLPKSNEDKNKAVTLLVGLKLIIG